MLSQTLLFVGVPLNPVSQVAGWQVTLDKLSALHGSPVERLEGSAQVLLQELLPQGLVR